MWIIFLALGPAWALRHDLATTGVAEVMLSRDAIVDSLGDANGDALAKADDEADSDAFAAAVHWAQVKHVPMKSLYERLMQTMGHRKISDYSCSYDDNVEFNQLFGQSAIRDLSWDDGEAATYRHPSSATAAVYLFTSKEGDANGAFAFEGTTCYRLLRMTAHHSVFFYRVHNAKDAAYKLSTVDQTITHLVIGGHGHPRGVSLGTEFVQVGSPGLDALLFAARSKLLTSGPLRSTVLLDACSAGKAVDGATSLAQYVASKLPGAQVRAFENPFSFVRLLRSEPGHANVSAVGSTDTHMRPLFIMHTGQSGHACSGTARAALAECERLTSAGGHNADVVPMAIPLDTPVGIPLGGENGIAMGIPLHGY